MGAGKPEGQLDVSAITEAVKRAELSTSGEIVPVVIERSAHYPAARWRLGVLVALLVAFILIWQWPAIDPMRVIWAEIPAFLVGYGLGSIGFLQRSWLARHEMSDEVHARALEVFKLTRINATRDRTGILILVSLYERRVQILADTGINQKVAAGTWDQIVSRLTGRIRSRANAGTGAGKQSLESGLIEAIRECGELLSHSFPRRADDTNELPDQPIV